jgi:hypothetical protein
MSQYAKDQPGKQADVAFPQLALRVLLAGLLAAVVLLALGFVLSSHRNAVLSPENIVIQIVSGLLYVIALTPLARRLFTRRFARFVAIFVPLYVTGTFTDLVEAYFYTTVLTPFKLVAALIVGAIPLLFITGIIAWLVPASEETRHALGIGQALRQRSLPDWLWRVFLAGALYVPIYLLFATLVTPIEHPFYSDPAFVAQLHTRVPPFSVTAILETVRGILFVLAQLPVLAVMRKSRWTTGLYIALISAVVEAWVPLLGYTSWPMMMRAGNLLELTGDALGRGLVMAILVALPLKRTSEAP